MSDQFSTPLLQARAFLCDGAWGGSLFVYSSIILDRVNNIHTEEETSNVHQNTNKEREAQKLGYQDTSREFHNVASTVHLYPVVFYKLIQHFLTVIALSNMEVVK